MPRLLNLVDEALEQPLVMVVDDDPDLCATLWDILRERGFRVCFAGDARSASDRLKDRSYKVLLVDLRLPDEDGVAVLRAVRESAPDARVVVITGQSESSSLVQDAVQEGVDSVCFKPLNISQLLQTLDRLAR